MRSRLLASVKAFHTMETYSNLDLSKEKYNIRRLSLDENEKVVARI
jgi:hypothetical protein